MERGISRADRAPGGVRPPALRVAADVGAAGDPARALASVHVRVSGGRAPVRLRFHVDGTLLAVQSGTGLTWEIPVGRLSPGAAHTVTVRADDALGCQAESSVRLVLPPPGSAAPGLSARPGHGVGPSRRVRRLVARIWG